MIGNKRGGDIELCDIMPGVITVMLPRRTSQVGATNLMVSLTPADAQTHLVPGHAGVGAGVVGLASNVLAMFVGVITPRPFRGFTGRGHGLPPTFNAYSILIVHVAGLPGLEAALLISGVWVEVVVVSSAVTGVTPSDALIPAHGPPLTPCVVAIVRVGGAVTRPRSSKHQQQDY